MENNDLKLPVLIEYLKKYRQELIDKYGNGQTRGDRIVIELLNKHILELEFKNVFTFNMDYLNDLEEK